MASKPKRVYRILFNNQGSVYELHARKVDQGSLYAFVQVDDIIFGERTHMLVDPAEERLKSEFGGVKRTFIPLHAVIRIDEVDKEGANKIHAVAPDKGNVAPFPLTVPPKPDRR